MYRYINYNPHLEISQISWISKKINVVEHNLCKGTLFIFPCSKRQDGLIKDYEKKQESHRETLSKLQQQFQQSQV